MIFALASMELFTRISMTATVNSALPPKNNGILSSNQKYRENRIPACSSKETNSSVFLLKTARMKLFFPLFKSCLPV